jgi:hypothetical protein
MAASSRSGPIGMGIGRFEGLICWVGFRALASCGPAACRHQQGAGRSGAGQSASSVPRLEGIAVIPIRSPAACQKRNRCFRSSSLRPQGFWAVLASGEGGNGGRLRTIAAPCLEPPAALYLMEVGLWAEPAVGEVVSW